MFFVSVFDVSINAYESDYDGDEDDHLVAPFGPVELAHFPEQVMVDAVEDVDVALRV